MVSLHGSVNGILICNKEINTINEELKNINNDFLKLKKLMARAAEVNKTKDDLINELCNTILKYPSNEYKIVKID